MELRTERLIIDPLRETDKEDYFTNISHDKKVLETFICRYAETLEDFDFSSYLANDTLFAIRLKESGRLIGIILFFDEKDGCCEIGYGLGSHFWGRGYASEAVARFLDYLFDEKGFRAVTASCFTGNDASRRVMEKCGMTYDRFVEKELSYLGVERDLSYYTVRRERKDAFAVRPLEDSETEAALALAWKVFVEYESPDYAPEGSAEFQKCLQDESFLAGIRYYGAFADEKLIGMLGIRPDRCHICFFFVDGPHHRRGVGTRLFARMREDFPDRTITLNSSPYGLPFYRKLGFTATAGEQTVNGIRFTPMEYKGERTPC